mmetsp:Transcript_4958/g.11906  ORF Transcript_4958/g.11906 Transcript_4958/m.11906 type:complete len:89 (-) Transcript_4958:236-502(-)
MYIVAHCSADSTARSCAVEGDPEIDTQKVDSTKHVTEYDDETQSAIRKIMFDQNQKMHGKPTSDEMQQHEMLRKAWDAEGTPSPVPCA